ncbi:hypothetical protein GCM10008959_29490 [Deinococcus seoulensis]|uniref:Ig-like domain-containing protein n=1 Tax=Deinococcus seoulensis TaxID=1837379 RepID=A0ABQ2RTG3_9DEIO|nr:hypothetical protein [Deinococcus seoulensis]GGR65378.1 hypothetical protein GCM10008959_29490 [Deinococcus seoulensis]
MNSRVLLPAVLILSSLLASCAPVSAMLAARDQDGPAPLSAGPLVVGQTWTVSGPIDGRTVTATIGIPDLVTVPAGKASVSERDRLSAQQDARAGFGMALYRPDARTLSFTWIAEDTNTYICDVSTPLALPFQGRLTMQRGGKTVVNGTCEANVSQ